MALTEKINEDLKIAMKSGDSIKLNTIRSIRALLIDHTKRGTGNTITQDEEISILLGAAKKRKEAFEIYEKAGRKDLAEQEQRELDIINSYLPKQIGREEVESSITQMIKQIGAISMKDLGKIMPLAMKEFKGKIDGKIIQEIVKQQLGG
jgi:uncharacterized protein YqeY